MDTPAAILHAVAERFLVNIEPDVIHTLHGGASLVVSESAGSLSSAFLHQALLHRLIHSNNTPRMCVARRELLRVRVAFIESCRELRRYSKSCTFTGAELDKRGRLAYRPVAKTGLKLEIPANFRLRPREEREPMNGHQRTYRLVFATAILATAIALTGIGRSAQFVLREATIADIQAAYRDGTLSPQQLVSMYLARIAALDQSDLPQPLDGGVGNQPLNSFMHVNENALADAGH